VALKPLQKRADKRDLPRLSPRIVIIIVIVVVVVVDLSS